MKCPRDTNGDGDCGRNLCPYCGEDAQRHAHRHLLALIGRVAADVWDAKTLVRHIEDMDLDYFVAGALRRRIAEGLGMAPAESSPHVYLDHLHQNLGRSHMALVEELRELAAEIDPDYWGKTFGAARDLAPRGARGVG